MAKENKHSKGNHDVKNKEDGALDTDLNLDLIKRIVNTRWFIISFIFIVSLLVHITYRTPSLFHFDSAYDAMMVEQSVRDWSLNYSYGWGTPGTIIIVGFFYFIDHIFTGTMSAEGAYTFVNILTASLAPVMLYLIVRKFSNKFVAASAALLFAFTPVWLTSTVYPKTHSLAMFFSLLACLLILIAGERKSIKMLMLAGLTAGIAMSVRPLEGGFILIPFGILYLFPEIKDRKLVFRKDRFNMKNAAAFIIPALLLLFIIMIPKFAQFGGIINFIKTFKGETRGGWLGLISPNFLMSLSFITKTITFLGWAAVAPGVLYLLKKRQILILGCLSAWFLIFFLYIGNLAVVDPRFLIPALPPLCILMAYGGQYLYEKKAIAGIALIAAILIWMFLIAYPLIEARHVYSGQKEFAEFVAMKTEPNSVVMVADEHVFIKRYAHRKTLNFGDNEKTIGAITKNLMNGTTVYMVESAAPAITDYEKGILSKYFIVSYVGEARNEVYQFSALQLRPYNERLFQMTLNETALIEAENNLKNSSTVTN